jgi:hypothetical protein
VISNLPSLSRNKSSVFLLVLALIVGGVGAQAAGVLNSPSGGYLVCVNSTTKVVTYPGTSSCPKGSKKLLLGAQGAAGTNGKDGKTLWNGVKDPESTWGAPGDMFINSVTKTLFGPKDLTTGWPAGVSMVGPAGAAGPVGATGAQGPAGAAGATGAQGPAGATGATGPSALKITEQYICGADHTSLCKIGAIGPGGGLIFFVDYNDQYAGFNYLEAAPTTCQDTRSWSSSNTSVPAVAGWAARAVGAGITNTTAIKAVFTSDTSTNNAAYYATSCNAGGKSDWFLGSRGEMKLMYDNLQGVGGFVETFYWSSSEYGAANANLAWGQAFYDGAQANDSKTSANYVRPVRAF